MSTRLLLALFLACHITPALGQNKPENDFDYLLGDWEFSARNQDYPEFRGRWTAVRLAEGQILDEYRVLDDKGKTAYVTTTLRNYNLPAQRWELVGADVEGGLLDFGTARRVGNDMHIEQRFGVAEGKPSLWRIRYYNIQADRFSWIADRSRDDGKTWVQGYMTLEARRIGPARTLPPLTGQR
ncbi:MAG TPA: hypothetical protein VGD27_06230 [Longimicrobiales bacterium]